MDPKIINIVIMTPFLILYCTASGDIIRYYYFGINFRDFKVEVVYARRSTTIRTVFKDDSSPELEKVDDFIFYSTWRSTLVAVLHIILVLLYIEFIVDKIYILILYYLLLFIIINLYFVFFFKLINKKINKIIYCQLVRDMDYMHMTNKEIMQELQKFVYIMFKKREFIETNREKKYNIYGEEIEKGKRYEKHVYYYAFAHLRTIKLDDNYLDMYPDIDPYEVEECKIYESHARAFVQCILFGKRKLRKERKNNIKDKVKIEKIEYKIEKKKEKEERKRNKNNIDME